eukprot:COSAG02_NODE_1053_length_14943_cov_3.871076_3_plen_60_part_00
MWCALHCVHVMVKRYCIVLPEEVVSTNKQYIGPTNNPLRHLVPTRNPSAPDTLRECLAP